MDILAYEYILQGLKDCNNAQKENFGNKVYFGAVRFGKNKTVSYPITIFNEIQNVANPSFNSCFDRVAQVGYRVDIFAQDKGDTPKHKIAREISKFLDKYLTNIGLTRVSYNVSDLEMDGTIYHIILTYTGNLHENRRILI